MKPQSHALAVKWNGEAFEATLPELHLTVTGTSHQEALIKALEAMDRVQVEELKAARMRRVHKRTVA
ncbi:MAG TPA: hypothetical protein VGM01_11970 [Ktedonobacteraceae bacterium]|jgi:hypothetical protein